MRVGRGTLNPIRRPHGSAGKLKLLALRNMFIRRLAECAGSLLESVICDFRREAKEARSPPTSTKDLLIACATCRMLRGRCSHGVGTTPPPAAGYGVAASHGVGVRRAIAASYGVD